QVAPRRFDVRVDLRALRRLQLAGQFGEDRSLGRTARDRLLHDLDRLLDLAQTHHVPVVDVPRLSNGNVEVELVVDGVRVRLTHVVCHARPAQGRSRAAAGDGVLRGDDANPFGPGAKDGVFG